MVEKLRVVIVEDEPLSRAELVVYFINFDR
jgi:hypothetical protein